MDKTSGSFRSSKGSVFVRKQLELKVVGSGDLEPSSIVKIGNKTVKNGGMTPNTSYMPQLQLKTTGNNGDARQDVIKRVMNKTTNNFSYIAK